VHHPTPMGLFFSILTQFTKKDIFKIALVSFFPISIDENGEELIGNNIPAKLFCGTIDWFFHLVSDMSGSNKTAGVGMGIPGPIVSLLKEISLIPGLNKTDLAKKIKEIFSKERFDLRSELAVGHELGRQAVPVILNEIIVPSFYFIHRLAVEIKEKKEFSKIEWKNTLPFKNRTIIRMLTIATSTFTLVDIADAAIRGAIKSGGNSALLAREFILRVNFVGIGRFAITVGTDIVMGVKKSKLRNERMAVYSEQLHLLNAKVYYHQADAWIATETTEQTINETLNFMEKTTSLFVEALKINSISLENIERITPQIKENNQNLIEDINDILKWGIIDNNEE
jgi:hypothetical protein